MNIDIDYKGDGNDLSNILDTLGQGRKEKNLDPDAIWHDIEILTDAIVIDPSDKIKLFQSNALLMLIGALWQQEKDKHHTCKCDKENNCIHKTHHIKPRYITDADILNNFHKELQASMRPTTKENQKTEINKPQTIDEWSDVLKKMLKGKITRLHDIHTTKDIIGDKEIITIEMELSIKR